MKWKSLCAATVVAIVMWSPVVFAQTSASDQSGADTGATTPQGPVMHSPSDMPSPSPSPPSDTMQAPAPSGGANADCDKQPSASINEETSPSAPHQIAGQVVALDRDNGTLTLRTDSGLIRFKGSPESLRDVNVGDAIVVEYVARSQAAGPDVAENGQESETNQPSASPCTE